MSDFKKSFDDSELSAMKKLYNAGLQPYEIEPFGRYGLIGEELEVVFDCFKAGLPDEQVKFILETADDSWQMNNLLVGFKAGISFDEMKNICSAPEYSDALDSRIKSLLEDYAKDKIPVADQILASYHPNRANLSRLAENLLMSFQKKYLTSGYMYSGSLKKEEILGAGYDMKDLNELLNANLVSRRNCTAESYELSCMERFSLIRSANALSFWEKHGGITFYLNNGFYGEFHSVLREVLASSQKEKPSLDNQIQSASIRSSKASSDLAPVDKSAPER